MSEMDIHPNAVTSTLETVPAADTEPPHRIDTDGLVLHRAHPSDVEFDRLHTLFSELTDPEEVFALCGWDGHESESATRAYLDEKVSEWKQGEKYEYVLEAPDGKYIGTACLIVDESDSSCELAFWLRKPYWGQGLCGRGVDALVHVAFESLSAPYVDAGCLPENSRSRRAIEKFVRRYNGAHYGTAPTVPSRSDGSEDDEMGLHHEWVITQTQYASEKRGISTFVPGVEYTDIDF
jgi:ribosomal-protein-alanine N-acetyltransferase